MPRLAFALDPSELNLMPSELKILIAFAEPAVSRHRVPFQLACQVL